MVSRKANNTSIMTLKNQQIEKFWQLAGKAKPLLVSPIIAPIAVVLAGIVLHAGFSVSVAESKVILGGPAGVVSVADEQQAGEITASNFIGDEELLDERVAPARKAITGDSVAAEGLFGGSVQARPDGVQVHVVGPSETLYSIANRYGIDQRTLAKANKAAGEVLIVGDELVIPVAGESTSATGPSRVAGAYLPKGFIWPLAGRISVGPKHGPARKDCLSVCARDLPSPAGTPVLASGAGTVIEASYNWNGGYGNRVIIDSGSVQIVSAHLSEILVHEGEQVVKGQTIGLVGSTGNSTGPHVHMEVRWQ